MKQIQIYELLPLLCPGFVAMDEDGVWTWFEKEPVQRADGWCCRLPKHDCDFLTSFNIAPFDGDWKDSLMECGDHIADIKK